MFSDVDNTESGSITPRVKANNTKFEAEAEFLIKEYENSGYRLKRFAINPLKN